MYASEKGCDRILTLVFMGLLVHDRWNGLGNRERRKDSRNMKVEIQGNKNIGLPASEPGGSQMYFDTFSSADSCYDF